MVEKLEKMVYNKHSKIVDYVKMAIDSEYCY